MTLHDVAPWLSWSGKEDVEYLIDAIVSKRGRLFVKYHNILSAPHKYCDYQSVREGAEAAILQFALLHSIPVEEEAYPTL